MFNLYRLLAKFVILTGMLLGLPLLGVILARYPVERYLQFPPQNQYVLHEPFTWGAFTVFAFMIATVVLPITIQGIRSYKKTPPITTESKYVAFPRWGWLGLILGVPAWILAWTRFPWCANWQPTPSALYDWHTSLRLAYLLGEQPNIFRKKYVSFNGREIRPFIQISYNTCGFTTFRDVWAK